MKDFAVFSIVLQIFFIMLLGFSGFLFVPTVSLLVLSFFLSFKRFSFFDLQNVFILLFFIIMPQIEIYNRVSYWGLGVLNTQEILHANICIFLYQLTAIFVQFGLKKFGNKPQYPTKFNLAVTLFLTSFSVIIGFFYYQNSLIRLFFRGFDSGFVDDSGGLEISNLEWLILEHFIRVVPFVSLLLYTSHLKSNDNVKTNWFGIFFLVLATLFLSAPSGTARFLVGIIYGSLILVNFQDHLKSRYIAFFLFMGLLIVFPFLDNFRNFNGEINLFFSIDYFMSGHFDAFYNLAKTSSVDITYGSQLMGVLFFFIPRNFWVDKPIHSGAYLANELQMSWDNISMPFVGEGYLNFGFLGVILFSFILSYIFLILDKKIEIKSPTGLLFIGIMFFIFRGSLMSAYAYGMGIFMAFWLVKKISLKCYGNF